MLVRLHQSRSRNIVVATAAVAKPSQPNRYVATDILILRRVPRSLGSVSTSSENAIAFFSHARAKGSGRPPRMEIKQR